MGRILKIITFFSLFFIFAFTIYLFVRASGGFRLLEIDTEIWGHFGTFIGSILLILTLLYQIKSFRKQQIEAKFFELIKYYRDNVAEMNFRNPFYYEEFNKAYGDKFVNGRRFFKIIYDQYKLAFNLIEDIYISKHTQHNAGIKNRDEWDRYVQTPEFLRIKCAIAYLIVYWGVTDDAKDDLLVWLQNYISEINANEIYKIFKRIYAIYEIEENAELYYSNLIIDNITYDNKNGGTKFFGGHQYHLGHYFRHLYQAVTFIDKQPWWLLSQTEKYSYIKTLRAQMSNYEQAIFYLNSLSPLGYSWERRGNKFITKYNLVKNIPENFIKDIKVQWFYPNVKYEWKL